MKLYLVRRISRPSIDTISVSHYSCVIETITDRPLVLVGSYMLRILEA